MLQMPRRSVLSLSDVVKTFPGVVALDGVSLDVVEGEVHALVGENGAGKSTLMAVAAGAISWDSGTIEIGGQAARQAVPRSRPVNGHQRRLSTHLGSRRPDRRREPALLRAGAAALPRQWKSRVDQSSSSLPSARTSTAEPGSASSAWRNGSLSRSPKRWRCSPRFSFSTSRPKR